MSTNDNTNEPSELDCEILIGRLIDDEANRLDQDHFEELADVSPELWRTLALRQRDMMTLSQQVDQATLKAVGVELHESVFPRRRLTWTLALSGWAAVLIVALSWIAIVALGNLDDGGVDVVGDQQGNRRRSPTVQITELSPQELLDQYRNTRLEYWQVIELAPVLLEKFTLEDGSLVIRSMRRFDETFVIPAPQAAKLLQMEERGEEIPIDPIELNRLFPKLSERPESSVSGPS